MESVEPEPPADGARARETQADLALVAEVRNGDRQAAQALAERLLLVPRYLWAINRRRGGPLSEHDLEDLSQETVIGIWGKLGSFRGPGTLDHWVYRFCLFEFMNALRKLKRRPRPQTLGDDVPGRAESDAGVEELLARLAEHPPLEVAIIELRHFDGLSFREIGDRLGLSKDGIKSRYHRIVSTLQRELRRAVPEEWL